MTRRNITARRNDEQHLPFPLKRPDITWQDIIECAADGLLMRDTGAIFGMCSKYLSMRISRKRPELASLFPHHGNATFLARRGYVPDAPVTPYRFESAMCETPGCGNDIRKTGRGKWCKPCATALNLLRQRIKYAKNKVRRPWVKPAANHPWRERTQ